MRRFSSTAIDGSLLHTMQTVQREAPQCFYEMLRSQFGLELLSLLKFVRALSRLGFESAVPAAVSGAYADSRCCRE